MDKRGVCVVMLVVILAMAACGPGYDGSSPAAGSNQPISNTAVPAISSNSSEPVSSTAAPVIASTSSSESVANTASSEPVSSTAVPVIASTSSSESVANAASSVTALNAGEINDNERWGTYLQYRNNYLKDYWKLVHDVNVSDRQIITVSDAEGKPVSGARVLVYNDQTLVAESQTYANGQTLFFPSAWINQAPTYRVVVQKDQSAVEFMLDPAQASGWRVEIKLPESQSASIPLDVLFLLDTTGSMADEITQLQNNIRAISAQIDALPGDVDARYGLVAYRDRADTYITQTHDFVTDVAEFQTTLNAVRASGGGDLPEALNEGLHEAVQGVSWRGDESLKLIFLVADAAPHLDYGIDYDYAQEMVAAAWKGIKINPIASSNLRDDGEYIFRQLAQYTSGSFIFLTYSPNGAPGSSRPDLHVGEAVSEANGGQGDYTVEQLDDLVLRLITDEIAAQNVPVSNTDGVSPQIEYVKPVPEQTMPTTFALFVPPSQQRITVVYPSAVGQISISPTMLVALVAGSLGIGYLLNVQLGEKRKRKNEELLAE